MDKRSVDIITIAPLFLLVFVASYFLRGLDDNSLFSWSWIFTGIEGWRIYLFMVAGIALSGFLSQWVVPDHYHIPFLGVVSFAVIIPLWEQPELIIDASRYFTQAKHLELYGVAYFVEEWGGTILAWTDMPLVPLLYGLIFKIFGESRTAIQIFTTTLFSLSTILTYRIGQRLWNREIAFSGALLLLGIPYLMTQVPLMLVDVPTLFFLTLAIFTFIEAVNRGGAVPAGFAVISIVFSIFSKYSSWLMLTVLPVILLVYWLENKVPKEGKHLRRGIFILAASAAVSGVMLILKSEIFFEQITLLRNYQQPGLELWGESFYSTFFFQTHPFISILAALSAAVALQKRDWKIVIAGWLILLFFFLNIKRIRYMLPAFPMLALMAGYGLEVVRRDIRRFILYGTVVSSLIILFLAYLPFAKSISAANLKHAGHYMNSLTAVDEFEVITLGPVVSVVNPAVSVPLLDLFTKKQVRYNYMASDFPPVDTVKHSSLRFTWLYRNPPYYSSQPDTDCTIPVVVISDVTRNDFPGPVSKKLEGCRLSAAFLESENIFRFTTGVRIYQK